VPQRRPGCLQRRRTTPRPERQRRVRQRLMGQRALTRNSHTVRAASSHPVPMMNQLSARPRENTPGGDI
jgi:hypothetical protein